MAGDGSRLRQGRATAVAGGGKRQPTRKVARRANRAASWEAKFFANSLQIPRAVYLNTEIL